MLLVGNGRLVTRNDAKPFIENGGVVLENGTIKEFGDFKSLKEKYPNAELVDAKGKVIMPGLINAHSHIYSAFARGMSLNGPVSNSFVEILENFWWRMDKGLNLDDTKYSAYATLLDSVRFGVTTVFDHHASPFHAKDSLFQIADVAKELGVRTNLCYEVSDRDGEEIFKAGVKENLDFMKQYNQDNQNMVKGMFGMHASFTISDKSMQYCADSMAGVDGGYHIHVAEGIQDLQACLKEHGKRVVERLYSFDVLREKTIAVHAIHVNERELQLLKDTNTAVVHNPESNMNNAVGCSPVIEMFKKEILVGLGTDAYTHDMFESLKVANIVHKDNLCNSNVGWGEAVSMLFYNNREIAGRHFAGDMGIIKDGALGDVIIVDYTPHTPMNENNIDAHAIFGMMGRSVTDTIINGKVVMRDRVIQTVDEEMIMAKSREQAQDLWNRLTK